MTSAYYITPRICEPHRLGLSRRREWALAAWRSVACCALFSLFLLPEFARDSNSDAGSPVYSKVFAGLRIVDIVILVSAFCVVATLAASRDCAWHFPRTLVLPGLGFVACVAFAMVRGYSRGGSNFFFDWRGLALGICIYIVADVLIRSASQIDRIVRLFAIYMGTRIALLFAVFLAGGRDSLLGVSIPVFDGPTLSCIVFTALLAFRYQRSASSSRARMLWRLLAAAAFLLVLLGFRRTYWGELAIGSIILLLMDKRHRLRNFAFLLLIVAVASAILGGAFSQRLASLDVSSSDTEFAADNADHLLDLVDAWSQVRASPLLGIGLGTSYSTWHIRSWKPESVMVHNAPLHVWLKYGVAGLLCYLWFHLAWLRWTYRAAKGAAARHAPLLSAIFAYLVAQFVNTLGFAPWPYSEVQLAGLLAFLLALAVSAHHRDSAFAYGRS